MAPWPPKECIPMTLHDLNPKHLVNTPYVTATQNHLHFPKLAMIFLTSLPDYPLCLISWKLYKNKVSSEYLRA